MNNRYALIVAGGTGSRMQANMPKQFLLLQGLPVLMHTIKKFKQAHCNQIVVVLPKNQFHTWEKLCMHYQFDIKHSLVEGGLERFDSVKNGLEQIEDLSGLIAVHDGVRPCITSNLINNLFNEAAQHGNAIPAVKPKESMRIQLEVKTKTVNRADYYLIQTPQVFNLNDLKEAYKQTANNKFTDDAAVFENNGGVINLVEGDYKNIKITTPEDLLIADLLLSKTEIQTN